MQHQYYRYFFINLFIRPTFLHSYKFYNFFSISWHSSHSSKVSYYCSLNFSTFCSPGSGYTDFYYLGRKVDFFLWILTFRASYSISWSILVALALSGQMSRWYLISVSGRIWRLLYLHLVNLCWFLRPSLHLRMCH